MVTKAREEKVGNKNTIATKATKYCESFFGEFKSELIWSKIIFTISLHVCSFVMLYLVWFEVGWKTIIWGFIMVEIATFGITAGVHRYWTHRTYKAKIPFQIILMICYSAAGQIPIYDWVRDHRVHHRYSETDADPHNSKRGIIFAHIGWLWMKKLPEVLRRGNEVDMSDILNDAVVQFHTRYFLVFKLLFCFLIPTAIPVYFWDEKWVWAFGTQCLIRYVVTLHGTWCINSIAHLYGHRPYDSKIAPRENFIATLIAAGEGWHNYHHTFPWDYKASELSKLNVTTMWLHFFSKIGWVYDMKSPSKQLVQMVMERRGDKSMPGDYKNHHYHTEIPDDYEQLLKGY